MKLLILGSFLKQEHRDKIAAQAEKRAVQVAFAESEDKLPEGFESPDIVYGFGVKTARTSKTLRWLCVPSAGVDYLMGPGAFANEKCILTNSSGAYGVTIAEHIIAVSLLMMRRLTDYHDAAREGRWATERYHQSSLKDARITVLGTGDIGLAFARRARAFEPAAIVGVNRSGAQTDTVLDRVWKIDALDRILTETDLLVMSLPSTPETQGILNRERILSLPRGAFVVNVGRGSAIDEEALADSLDSGHLGGAALDVFQTEPLPSDSRLWKTKNLLITPHVAGNLTLDYTLDKNVDMFLEDLDNFCTGRPLRYVVDRARGY
ncbi:MAG: D-2-hydroxyacid dehydrogenase [Lachnospiraceae bacterium]|nr:D-2-hydroxyacid dehydrogenase [Lachnospiraceae bacterium]